MVFAANLLVAGRLAWTPGGFALSFGRMLQDGIVERYLADRCPDARLQLCAHRKELPHDADEFFWGSELFDSLGRFAGLGKEMERIALDSIVTYPAMQIETAAIATARQLVDVHTGEGVVNTIWHTYAIIEQRTLWAAPAMQRARQQNEGFSFRLANMVHWPVALASMALLPFIVLARRRIPSVVRRLAAAALIAILTNAAICGILSNPHDRYGARLAWLAPFVVIVAALRWRKSLEST
jgi:branched-subunit amino acid transport protein AzlD